MHYVDTSWSNFDLTQMTGYCGEAVLMTKFIRSEKQERDRQRLKQQMHVGRKMAYSCRICLSQHYFICLKLSLYPPVVRIGKLVTRHGWSEHTGQAIVFRRCVVCCVALVAKSVRRRAINTSPAVHCLHTLCVAAGHMWRQERGLPTRDKHYRPALCWVLTVTTHADRKGRNLYPTEPTRTNRSCTSGHSWCSVRLSLNFEDNLSASIFWTYANILIGDFQSISQSINHFISSIKANKWTAYTDNSDTKQDRQGS